MQNRDPMQNSDPLNEPELSAERMAALDKPVEPHARVEEQIVVALRTKGVLRDAHHAVVTRRRAPLPLRRVWAAAAAMAASALLFFGGTKVGEWRSAPAAVRQKPALALSTDSHDLSQLLDSAATHYVAALSRVQPGDALASAVAIQSFAPAAAQIARIAPYSKVALALQVAFPNTNVASAGSIASLAPPSRLIWY